MTDEEFRNAIKVEINKPYMSQDTRTILVQYRDSGGTQQNALENLNEILSEIRDAGVDEIVEDSLLETMDTVVGWCMSGVWLDEHK